MPLGPDRPPLELWGGVECTVNRVGDAYFDQLHLGGHDRRPEDLDRFAALGLRAIRYPVLWERTAPDGPDCADWRWPDERLGRLRELDVRPIVGLVHHGSGPRGTSLVDPSFVDGLAAYAGAVAARYPWVEAWTPVNEPLTTARFSGLYGHWYPHGRDETTFVRALLIQCRAVVAAMGAIRAVNPAARLVQTEDLGKVWSTPALGEQAAFENERRWLSFDLLCGRVGPDHRMWHHLRWLGVPEAELAFFQEHPCPPDVVGVNHYLTSERFLDERLERYPSHVHGGNPWRRYADVEAVRVLADGPAGPAALLRETWERYRLPIAVTEAHLGCTREEQLRWLAQVWAAAIEVRGEGADVRAVAAWSLLGAYDWDSLLTRAEGRYEPGVFDLRAPGPRPTALAGLLRDLAAGRAPNHPVLGTPGWWLRPHRLLYAPVARGTARPPARPAVPEPGSGADRVPPILIVGDGALADVFVRHCEARGIARHRIDPSASDDDAADPAEAAIAAHAPWAVVDARDPLRRDDPADPLAAVALAAACARRAIPLLLLSSDRVFDGAKTTPYLEGDPVAPHDEAGALLAEREIRVRAAHPGALIARVGPLFGDGAGQAAAAALRALVAGVPPSPGDDVVVSPTYVPDLVEAALDLLIDGEQGLWHLANAGAVRWSDLLRDVVALVGLDPALVFADSARAPTTTTSRALGSDRGWVLPPLTDALTRYAWEIGPSLRVATAVDAASAGPVVLEPWPDDEIRRAS